MAAQAPSEVADKPSDTEESNLFDSRSLQLFISVVSQTTIIVGSLFYFGYVRASSTFGYLGIDITLLGFSTVDYVLRSGNSVFVPVLAIALFLLYFRLAVELLRRVIELRPVRGTAERDVPWGVAVAITSAGVVAIPLVAAWAVNRTLGAGVFFLLFVVAALVSILTVGPSFASSSGQLRGLVGSLKIPIGAIAIAAFFYATAMQAQAVGDRVGREVEERVADRPGLIVYAETPLGMASRDGVVVEPLSEAEGRYRFRIGGLRLLTTSAGKYFLLKPAPPTGRADVVVIAESDVRIHVTRD